MPEMVKFDLCPGHPDVIAGYYVYKYDPSSFNRYENLMVLHRLWLFTKPSSDILKVTI